ncbi:MAG: 2-oxo acid dehydrogenase subunit E2 [Chloroflexia bacterium]|nr:2-oxo acid dehydrogenase subunit E2 [Chloroflexia bacterium]
MAKTMIMPQMGYDMTEGTLLRWLKQVGDDVERGEPIAEIETDKVTIEIEAFEGGVLTETLVSEGDTVPVGTPVAKIGVAGEAGATAEADAEPDVATASAETNGRAATGAPPAQPAAPDQSAPTQRADADGAAADAIGQAQAEAVPVGGNGAAANAIGRAQAESEAAPAGGNGAVRRAPGERLRASPLVKRLAEEHGIDLSQVGGSGPGGRIVKDDIKDLLTGAPAQARPAGERPQVQPQPQPVGVGPVAGVPRDLSRIRRTTGRRMAESKQVIPHFYVSSEVDMAAAAAFRTQVNEQVNDDAAKISYNDLIVKACALALREFPNLNSGLEGDQLYDHASIDINIAVAIEGGLIAPFITAADDKSLGTIARMAKDLVSRARSGGLAPEEFQGGTFTVSNLGMYDVAEFIAIINPPQAAILAVGSIKEMPVVRDGAVTAGQRMTITLSADHRISDGVEVARFLQTVKRYLEHPLLLALA